MMEKFAIPLSVPNLSRDDLREITACFNSTWISSKSKWVAEFENSFARIVGGTKYAVSVNSGTSALFLALKCLGIGPGDEVIIPDFTMIATVSAVLLCGATPVLVDGKSLTDWNMDPSSIETKVTKKTRAIIMVHIYGYPCDIKTISDVAKKYKLFLIEDAAEAMGSMYNNKKIGCFGDMACFSLYSNKIITTGNGGIITTNSARYYSYLKKLRFFDHNSDSHFTHRITGYNFALAGLLAALGYSQIKRFPRLLKKRKTIYSWYKKYMNNPDISFIEPSSWAKSNHWFPALIFSSKSRLKAAQRSLTDKNIETRVFFRPVHKQPVYKHMYKNEQYPVADYFWNHGLLMPSFHTLEEDQVKYICSILNSLNCSK